MTIPQRPVVTVPDGDRVPVAPPVAPLPVHAVATFAREDPSGLHRLARAFHDGDAAAAEAVAGMVADVVSRGCDWLPAGPPAAVVAVPGHRPGAGNPGCLALAARLVAILGWPEPVHGALERVAPSPEGRTAMARTPAEEVPTLRWDATALPGAGWILLLDDVTRTGATLTAAVHAAPPALAGRLVPLAVFRATSAGDAAHLGSQAATESVLVPQPGGPVRSAP